MMRKLPYIPDKRLYAAVMGACSYVRDTGWFNKAVSYYADKYNVAEDEVAKYVRIAQENGQKEKNSFSDKRKYKWFAVEYSIGNERNGGCYFDKCHAEYTVVKGLSADTVRKRLSAHDDYKSEYALCHWFGRIECFDTEAEAEDCVNRWKDEHNPENKERTLTDDELSEYFSNLRKVCQAW